MNARVRVWGTWILSILFCIWVVMAWFASMPVFMIVMLASVAAPPSILPLRLVATFALFWVLPPCVAVGGLHLWRKTSFPWLAIVPALAAVAAISTFITYGRLFFLGQP